MIQPVARPVSLKNQSIELISRFAPQSCIGRIVKDTVKGTVAHLRPPADSVVRVAEQARPGWVIFPKYQAGATATLTSMGRAEAFMGLAQNAFNYSLLAEEGFRRLTALVNASASHSFHYSDLEAAASVFDKMAEQRHANM